MPPLSPKSKQALSALGVSLVGALLTWGNQYLHLLPGPWAVLGSLVLSGVAHYVPALGTTDAVLRKTFSTPRGREAAVTLIDTEEP